MTENVSGNIALTHALDCYYEMKKFGQIIRELFNETHLSQRAFSEKAGINKGTLWNIFSYETVDECRPSTFQALAIAFGMTSNQLDAEIKRRQSGNDAVEPPVRASNFTIPRVSRVSAGAGADFAVDFNTEDGVPGAIYPYPQHDPLAIKVQGSSMMGPAFWQGLNDGDDVIIANRLDEEAVPGMVVVAMRNSSDDVYVKVLESIDDNRVVLKSLNPNYPNITIPREDVTLRPVKAVVRYPYRWK